MAWLFAIMANTVATTLLIATTNATNTTLPGMLGTGAIHCFQVYQHMIAAATTMGTHTTWGLPTSTGYPLSQQCHKFKVLQVRDKDLAVHIGR